MIFYLYFFVEFRKKVFLYFSKNFKIKFILKINIVQSRQNHFEDSLKEFENSLNLTTENPEGSLMRISSKSIQTAHAHNLELRVLLIAHLQIIENLNLNKVILLNALKIFVTQLFDSSSVGIKESRMYSYRLVQGILIL